MSNSSESDSNVHHSDSEELVRTNRIKRNKYRPNLRLIQQPNKETKDDQWIQIVDSSESGNDVIVQDGMMKAPPTITTPEAENVPLSNEKPEEEDKGIENEYSSPEELIYNIRALPKHSPTYELEKFEKNAMIIFNQESIDGYRKRLGTEKDAEALETTFKKFGFEVTDRKDLTKADLFSELEAFSNTDFTEYGCIAVAILTHGSKNGLLRARDAPYCEMELLNLFMDKPMLVSKPILFIIQACRGTKQTAGVAVHTAGRVRRDLDEEVEPYTLPVESDMLILHSSYVGKPSHRNEIHGSWFIQSLCSKIDDMADSHDFESILTEVKREVAIDRHHNEYNRRTLEMVTNKQMPVTTSTLIRKLYLKKFGEDEISYSKVETERQDSRNEVLDCGTPRTPLFGRCSCFLAHFEYIKSCLRHYVEDNPADTTAQGFLNIANTFKSDRDFDTPKEVMLQTICNHLMTNAQACTFYKYLYLYSYKY
ncbi:caspase-3-like [Cydia amplana]|uniref:caspase-3-like n=1 Tax=Cydia amplana TaxID=1869771 RepID=UPI002FE60DA7